MIGCRDCDTSSQIGGWQGLRGSRNELGPANSCTDEIYKYVTATIIESIPHP